MGDGTSISIWSDPWLPNNHYGFLSTSAHPELSKEKVSSLFLQNVKQWDRDIIVDLFNERDRNLILNIPLSYRQVKDSWYWCFDPKDVFLVKNCYRVVNGDFDTIVDPIWSRIWHLRVPNKVENFLWRASVDCLSTNVALVLRHVPISAQCPLCNV